MNILLVDDHPENLLALESVLGDLGENLVRASSGRDALKEVLREDFAVILMDVQMPEMNGFETATLIRERPRSRNTPILFLTAINKSDAHVAAGYAVGAVDYVFKPFQPDILKAKVAAFVDLARKNRELTEEVARRKAAEEEVLRLNAELEARVKRRTAELEAANRKLHREIAERRQAQEENARHQQAIEALNQRLQRAMTETHHRVKNNLQIISAMVDMRLLEDGHQIRAEELRRLGVHVRTLAAVHDILTQEAKEDGEAHSLSSHQILEQLLAMLQQTAGERRIHYEIAEARLMARQATSLALIVNELVSNALKYGRSDTRVRFETEGDRATLSVLDDGPGFPLDFDPLKAANTGLELVCNLSKWDLNGDLRFRTASGGGGMVSVVFPLTASC